MVRYKKVKNKKKRKICIVINNRANYARIKYFLYQAQKSKILDLKILLGASANLQRYGALEKTLRKDGFKVHGKIYSIVEGENPLVMAKSTGLATIELASAFDVIKPHIVLTVADRYETLATAIAASYMNIFLAHTQGGEVTGSIDESVRHSITKLAHVHFPSTRRAYEYIFKMGENKKNIHLTGCPSIDILKNSSLKITSSFVSKIEKTKTGGNINFTKKYVILIQHPVTTEYQKSKKHITETINAVKKLNQNKIQIIWLWPNIDAGSDIYSKEIRKFREKNDLENIIFYKNFTPEEYAILLKNSSCIIGNSSSGIREASYLGVPSVNIGNRQLNREISTNTINVNHNSQEIYKTTLNQIKKSYKSSQLYGNGNAGQKMVKILEVCELNIFKKLNYINN